MKNARRIICIILVALVLLGTVACIIPAHATNIKSQIMGDNNILSYKYSENDDYWYTDKDNAWQHKFGYSALYDIVAPYLMMEYDYARVHFEYDGKDWMVQLWKGQYGPFFYGCETGVYTKDHSDKDDTTTTFYNCASNDERLKIQTNLYKYNLKGEETREFSTPYEDTWWSTGFKSGHLIKEEPASELKQTGTITLDTPEMAKAFADGLKECGFKQVNSKDKITEDTYYLKGNTVEYSWRYISEAENTMVIKAVGAAAIFTYIGFIAAIVLGFFGLCFLGLVII